MTTAHVPKCTDCSWSGERWVSSAFARHEGDAHVDETGHEVKIVEEISDYVYVQAA